LRSLQLPVLEKFYKSLLGYGEYLNSQGFLTLNGESDKHNVEAYLFSRPSPSGNCLPQFCLGGTIRIANTLAANNLIAFNSPKYPIASSTIPSLPTLSSDEPAAVTFANASSQTPTYVKPSTSQNLAKFRLYVPTKPYNTALTCVNRVLNGELGTPRKGGGLPILPAYYIFWKGLGINVRNLSSPATFITTKNTLNNIALISKF
jgi:hypothetical protein